jgi:hypothetical protein
MQKPNIETCSEKEYKNWYWSDYNDQCKKCKKSCKQSHVPIQVICNKFENKLEV